MGDSDEEDDRLDAGRRGGTSGAPPAEGTGNAIGPVYQMWESALEKLKLLGYEQDFCAAKHLQPLNRVHFVFPGANASHQFTDFIEVSKYLCDIIGGPDLFQKEQFDDPNTMTNKIMLSLRKLDFRGGFAAQKLKAASGEAVCSVLDFLTDKALEKRQHRWEQPVYADGEDVEVEGDEQEDEAEGIDEENEAGVDEDVMFQEAAGDEVDVSIDHSAHAILHAEVDPVAWKTELERVGPRLKAQQQLATNEWRAHVDQTTSNRELIDKVLADTQGDLGALHRDVSEEVSKMATKEKYINHQFTSIQADFREVKEKMEALEKKSGASNESVAKLTSELTELTERMDDLKESFESKDSGIHDTSPLVRIKAALQQIKQEAQAFDLRIGVVSHSLLTARVSVTARRRIGAQQHARRRHIKNKKKAGAGGGDYSDEDEE